MKKNIISILTLTLIVFSCKNEIPKMEYQILTEDIDNFWEAHDALKDSKDSIATFQSFYIDKATPEFKKFIELRGFFTEEYVALAKNKPRFLKTIRPLLEAIKNDRAKIDEIYLKMARLYPTFKAPNICFAISPTRTGGTTDKGLILIGAEIAAVDPKIVDLTEITGFLKNVFESKNGNVIHLVAHELVHTQQILGDNENVSLLSQAITEGAADFIGSLLIGEQIMNPAIFNYGEANEKDLWTEFYQDVKNNKGFSDTDWFYNYNSNRPADLGYYIGYKICQSYYKKNEDNKSAIKEIIEMKDPKLFLMKSGYMNKFDN
ncbi:DUF2268 domain-containing protein [Muriicola sp. Z0-33]|uniref:DUF2268 domain-containing protein n=1 Tax=Muriicola sp. Z0-33 TaxID=2816957 RepID=UPI00223878B0|nr:DUF2268 domain-containing protein [Muriicola sp. Z0-33]MCW5518108.1 hypothetical protein [Muriicola sp. Z0-33]